MMVGNKRVVEWVQQKKLYEYQPDDIPVQWQAWLRHTRKDPPSMEELRMEHERRQALLKIQQTKDSKEWSPMLPGEAFEPESWKPKGKGG
jgi:NADH:ubiquinone oxidoreductase subunit